MKPKRVKEFDGRVVRTPDDWADVFHMEDSPVYYCDVIDILCEWRYFIHNGKLAGARYYAGSFDIRPPDLTTVHRAIDTYVESGEAPTAFALDFARVRGGQSVLVEANDCYALGSYDFNSTIYARMLATRWLQLTGGGNG